MAGLLPENVNRQRRALRRDYFVLQIRKPDGSKHLVRGFKTKAEANAWAKQGHFFEVSKPVKTSKVTPTNFRSAIRGSLSS